MFESVSNGFRRKEAPFNFLASTYNGEVAKLTRPWFTFSSHSLMLQNKQFQYSPIGRLIMGKATRLSWLQMTYIENPRYTNCEYPEVYYFRKVSSSWERLPVIGSVANLQHFVTMRRFTYGVIGQWPDLTWKWKKKFVMSDLTCSDLKMKCFIWSGLNGGGVGHDKFQLSIANGSRAIARKPSRGGVPWHHHPRPTRFKRILAISLPWISVTFAFGMLCTFVPSPA